MITFCPATLPDRFYFDPAHKSSLTEDSEFIFATDDPDELPKGLQIRVDPGKHKVQIKCGRSSAWFEVRVQNGSEIHIGDGVTGHWEITAFSGSRTIINNDCSSRGRAVINCGFGNHFELGADAMLAEDVRFNIGDQHAIIDLETCQPLNQVPASLTCGKHVWIGYGSVVMISGRNVRIGSGSIVGARSLVTRSIPDFSLAAGVPAKVIKDKVTWARKYYPNSDEIQQLVKLWHDEASHHSGAL